MKKKFVCTHVHSLGLWPHAHKHTHPQSFLSFPLSCMCSYAAFPHNTVSKSSLDEPTTWFQDFNSRETYIALLGKLSLTTTRSAILLYFIMKRIGRSLYVYTLRTPYTYRKHTHQWVLSFWNMFWNLSAQFKCVAQRTKGWKITDLLRFWKKLRYVCAG